jgi:hypothetical protein
MTISKKQSLPILNSNPRDLKNMYTFDVKKMAVSIQKVVLSGGDERAIISKVNTHFPIHHYPICTEEFIKDAIREVHKRKR